MASITSEMVDQMVAAHAGGQSMYGIAKDLDVSSAAVKYHLKARGVFGAPADEPEDDGLPIDAIPDPEPVQSIDDLLRSAPAEEAPAAPNAIEGLAALLATPGMPELLALLKGAPAAPAPGVPPEMFSAFVESLQHVIQVNAEQRPGYIKPLPAEEVDRRNAGKAEMERLLAWYSQIESPPKWMVGRNGFVESTEVIELKHGDELYSYLPPAEDFKPLNPEAEAVMEAHRQWLGVPTEHIADQVAEAERRIPVFGKGFQKQASKIEVIRQLGPDEEAGPRRRMTGSLVPDPRPVTDAQRLGGAGPFDEAAAA